MDDNLIAILGLVVVNVGLIAFSYGRLSQKVSDACKRLDRIEKAINSKGNK